MHQHHNSKTVYSKNNNSRLTFKKVMSRQNPPNASLGCGNWPRRLALAPLPRAVAVATVRGGGLGERASVGVCRQYPSGTPRRAASSTATRAYPGSRQQGCYGPNFPAWLRESATAPRSRTPPRVMAFATAGGGGVGGREGFSGSSAGILPTERGAPPPKSGFPIRLSRQRLLGWKGTPSVSRRLTSSGKGTLGGLGFIVPPPRRTGRRRFLHNTPLPTQAQSTAEM